MPEIQTCTQAFLGMSLLILARLYATSRPFEAPLGDVKTTAPPFCDMTSLAAPTLSSGDIAMSALWKGAWKRRLAFEASPDVSAFLFLSLLRGVPLPASAGGTAR